MNHSLRCIHGKLICQNNFPFSQNLIQVVVDVEGGCGDAFLRNFHLAHMENNLLFESAMKRDRSPSIEFDCSNAAAAVLPNNTNKFI